MGAGTIIDVWLKWKKYKGYYDQLQRLNSRSEKFSKYSSQVRELIKDYAKAKEIRDRKAFEDAEKKILERLTVIRTELTRIANPSPPLTATKPGKAVEKATDYLVDEVLAEWAGMELMQIAMHQDAGNLPPDPTPWPKIRRRIVDMRDAMNRLALSMSVAANQVQKDIDYLNQVMDQLRSARNGPGITKEDIDLMAEDYEDMLRQERELKQQKQWFEQMSRRAQKAAENLDRTIEVRDAAAKN